MKVLVIEDGWEYSETLGRFLADGFSWHRAGSGGEALQLLSTTTFDAVFLDMRFDRVPDEALLGDWEAAADRFNGDPVRGRQFLQDHQGTFVLAELRRAGHPIPVLLSHDFESEPRRWSTLARQFAPVDFLPDNHTPTEVRARLTALVG